MIADPVYKARFGVFAGVPEQDAWDWLCREVGDPPETAPAGAVEPQASFLEADGFHGGCLWFKHADPDPACVAHECLHAAIRVTSDCRVRCDEALCYYLEFLVREVTYLLQRGNKVPYKLKKVKGGYKVASPSGTKSDKPMTKAKARAQQKAIYANAKTKK